MKDFKEEKRFSEIKSNKRPAAVLVQAGTAFTISSQFIRDTFSAAILLIY